MFGPTRYLHWARRFYGSVRYDLATSGVPTVPLAELGPLPVEQLDEPSGFERFRAAVAAYNAAPLDEVVPALGTSHALWLAYASLASPGDDVLVEEPAYEPLVRAAEGTGLRVVRFERSAGERWALDPDRIARAMTPRTRIVCVTNLHNPTGVRAPDDTLRAAARVAEAGGAWLLVDEVYAPFDDLVDARGIFARSARRLAPNIVAVASLTKAYGLGPERVGWLLGPADVAARAADAVLATCGALPLAHANVAARAFERLVPLAGRARAILAGKRARVAEWVRSQGCDWSAPESGLFALVTPPGRGDSTAALESLARDEGVLVAPGAFFGVPHAFRLAWSAPDAIIEEGLARLGRALPGLAS